MAREISSDEGAPAVDLRTVVISAAVLGVVPEELARAKGVLPLRLKDHVLYICTRDPNALALLDEVSFVTGRRVVAYSAPRHQIDGTIHQAYSAVSRGMREYRAPSAPAGATGESPLEMVGAPEPTPAPAAAPGHGPRPPSPSGRVPVPAPVQRPPISGRVPGTPAAAPSEERAGISIGLADLGGAPEPVPAETSDRYRLTQPADSRPTPKPSGAGNPGCSRPPTTPPWCPSRAAARASWWSTTSPPSARSCATR